MTAITIIYIIAGILFIASLIFERKVTVLDLFLAIFILAIPVLNIILFAINGVVILHDRGIINMRNWRERLINFLNMRIK